MPRASESDAVTAKPAEDRIVDNLIDALDRLRVDLDRVELWATALTSFQHPAPEYEPGDQYLLPVHPEAGTHNPRR